MCAANARKKGLWELGIALLLPTWDCSYKTLHRCRARNTKQSRFSSRGRSPFKNSPFNEKLLANRNSDKWANQSQDV